LETNKGESTNRKRKEVDYLPQCFK
jgi:hypothetical protein